MVIPLLITVSILLLVAIAIAPRLSMIIVWPILLLYPNNLWNKANLLPMAIGFDDLFIVAAAVVVLVRHNLWGGHRIYVGFSVIAASVFFILAVVANTSGYARTEGDTLYLQGIVKDVLKLGVMALFTYSMANTINSARDLRRVLFAVSIGVALAGLVAIASYVYPQLCNYFWDVRALTGKRVLFRRATGSLIHANTLGLVMALGITLTVIIAGLTHRLASRVMLAVCAAVMFIAIILSQSRTGVVCLAAGSLTILFLRGSRRWVIASAFGLLVATPLLIPIYQPLSERFSRIFHSDLRQLGPNVQGRLEIQKGYLESMDSLSFALGSGTHPAMIIAGTDQKPHSGYLDILCFYGIGGVAWLLLVSYGIQWRIRYLRRSRAMDGPEQTGNIMLVSWVIFAAASFSTDTFASPFPLYLFWTGLALADRATHIVRERGSSFVLQPAPGS